MANPIVHSKSSVRLWGGEVEDYLPLHNKMDCSKKYFSDNRHRTLTHNMFFIFEVMIPLFGEYITNSKGKIVSVKDICEYHRLNHGWQMGWVVHLIHKKKLLMSLIK